MKYFLLPLILFASQAHAITFEKTYGDSGSDVGKSVFQTNDGGYIIAGYTNSFGAGLYDAWLIKTDSLGDTLWTKTYGGTGNDSAEKMEKTSDNGYVIIGTTESCDAIHSDIWLIKIDSLGDTLWTKTYVDTGYERGRAVKQTADGGYIIVGGTYEDSIQWYGNTLLIKTDSLGNILWKQLYPSCNGNSIHQTQDLGYIVGGGDGIIMFFLKTDSSGNSVWEKSYGGGLWTSVGGRCLTPTPDGGYIQVGCFWDAPNKYFDEDIYCMKTDSLGTNQWDKKFCFGNVNYTTTGFYIEMEPDTSYIITGVYQFTTLKLLKISSAGDSIWARDYRAYSNENYGHWVKKTLDGGYIITGYTSHSGIKDADVYLVKTDSLGYVAVEESPNPHSDFLTPQLSAFPNPFINSTLINYDLPITIDDLRIAIYDLSGKLIEKTNNPVIGKNLHPGVYFIKVGNSNPTKIIKLSPLR